MITKTIRTSIAIAALMIAPITAQAADLPTYRGPTYIAPVPVFSWTGFYVGLNAGYLWGNSNWSGSAGNFQVTPTGFIGGGTLGYNLQTGLWVLGVEGDIDYVNVNGTAGAAFCPSCTFKDTWLGTIRGRVGYSFDRWLPYLTGGLAFGNMHMPSAGGSANETKTGWALGAGVEYAFAGAWSAKLEYLYVDLGSVTCSAAACLLPADESVNFNANIVRAGVNYRF